MMKMMKIFLLKIGVLSFFHQYTSFWDALSSFLLHLFSKSQLWNFAIFSETSWAIHALPTRNEGVQEGLERRSVALNRRGALERGLKYALSTERWVLSGAVER